jgi:hypothetical protein
MGVFIIEFFFDKHLFELAGPDPGEELQFELPAVEDLVLEGDLHLLHLPL